MYYYVITQKGFDYKVSDVRILRNKNELVYGQTKDKWFIPTDLFIDKVEAINKCHELIASYSLFINGLKKVDPKDEELLKIIFTMEYFCVNLSDVHKGAAYIIKKVANKYRLLLN